MKPQPKVPKVGASRQALLSAAPEKVFTTETRRHRDFFCKWFKALH